THTPEWAIRTSSITPDQLTRTWVPWGFGIWTDVFWERSSISPATPPPTPVVSLQTGSGPWKGHCAALRVTRHCPWSSCRGLAETLPRSTTSPPTPIPAPENGARSSEAASGQKHTKPYFSRGEGQEAIFHWIIPLGCGKSKDAYSRLKT